MARYVVRTTGTEAIAAYEARRMLATLVLGARTMRGITQADLAKRAGTSQAKISGYERGEENPTWDTLARIFGVLGMSLSLAPSELEAVLVPQAEYAALVRDREDLGELRKGIQGVLLNRAGDAAHEPVAMVTFPSNALTRVPTPA